MYKYYNKYGTVPWKYLKYACESRLWKGYSLWVTVK